MFREKPVRDRVQIKVGGLIVLGLILGGCGSEGTEKQVVPCDPGELICVDGAIHQCLSADGSSEYIAGCPQGELCSDGRCIAFGFEDAGEPDQSTSPPDTNADVGSDQGQFVDLHVSDLGPFDTVPADNTVHEDAAFDAASQVDIIAPEDGASLDGTPFEDATSDVNDVGEQDVPVVDAPDVADVAVEPDVTAEDTNTQPVLTPTPFQFMDYELTQNLVLKSSVVDIGYIPNSAGAAFLVAGSQLGLIEPDEPVVEVHDFDPIHLERVGFAPDFEGALLVGYETTGSGSSASTQGRLYRVDPQTGAYEELSGSPVPGVRPVAIVADPEGGFYMVSRSSFSYLTHFVHKVNADGTVQLLKGHTGSAGATDAVLAQANGILFGTPFLLVVSGWNGADSWSYVPSLDEVIDNNFSGGNAGRAAWRPGGSYGLVNATSTNKVYQFDGSWASKTLPTAGSSIQTHHVSFSPYGNLAILVGRAFQDQGTVVVHENNGPTLDTAVYTLWSVPGFFGAPYFADSSTFLLSSAFNPASSCGEGLIGSSVPSGQAFALILRFSTAPCP